MSSGINGVIELGPKLKLALRIHFIYLTLKSLLVCWFLKDGAKN